MESFQDDNDNKKYFCLSILCLLSDVVFYYY